MNAQEALKLYAAISMVDPYAKARTPEEVAAIAEQIADLLPTTPLDWAMGYVRQSMREGNIPAVTDIAKAWGPEARRRVESVPVPPAPEHIEADPQAWQEWERARRRALIGGATPQQAHAYANRQVGAPAPRAQIDPAPGRAEEAKALVKAKLAAWEERQRREQEAAFDIDKGGSQ